MKPLLPYASVFSLLSFAAAYFAFPFRSSEAAFPKWAMELEAAVLGFAVAMAIGAWFRNRRGSGAAVLAGFLTVLITLLLVCITVGASQYLYYPQAHASFWALVLGVGLMFVFWVLALFFPAFGAWLEVNVLIAAAVVSAVALIRQPTARWSRTGSLVAVLTVLIVTAMHIGYRTFNLYRLNSDVIFFTLRSEQILLGTSVLLCGWLWLTLRPVNQK